jgi:hypothetical protein
MAQHYLIFLFQSFETAEILLLVFPFLIGTGLIYLYVMQRKSVSEKAARKCPHCAKMVDVDSRICPFCQRKIA